MEDIKDLKQLIENVRYNINKTSQQNNKDFGYTNNGSLPKILVKRFIEQNTTKEDQSQMIKNNIKTKKNIKKYNNVIHSLSKMLNLIIIPNSFFIFGFVISQFKSFDNIITNNSNILFILSLFITFFLMFGHSFSYEKRNKEIIKYRKYISDNLLFNYNNKILKTILSITKDLNTMKNKENMEYIDLINERLIEQAYLFENGKIEDFIDNSLRNIIITTFAHKEANTQKDIETKIIKKEDMFENISLEEKIDFLERKIT